MSKITVSEVIDWLEWQIKTRDGVDYRPDGAFSEGSARLREAQKAILRWVPIWPSAHD